MGEGGVRGGGGGEKRPLGLGLRFMGLVYVSALTLN